MAPGPVAAGHAWLVPRLGDPGGLVQVQHVEAGVLAGDGLVVQAGHPRPVDDVAAQKGGNVVGTLVLVLLRAGPDRVGGDGRVV